MSKQTLQNQLETAKYNYNYFIMKLIIKILQASFKLSIILLISSIINNPLLNILSYMYIILTIFNIYNIITNYKNLIEDIKTTLKIDKITFEIDINAISNNLFKGMINYGK